MGGASNPPPPQNGVDIMNIEFCKECADFNKCTHKEKDCPYFEEEQAELNEKASKMPRNYEKSDKSREKKPKTVKVSDEKKELFDMIYGGLIDNYGGNVEILKENKLIQVKINEKIFKVDLIEQRMKKS